jgi:hypothetical protein
MAPEAREYQLQALRMLSVALDGSIVSSDGSRRVYPCWMG